MNLFTRVVLTIFRPIVWLLLPFSSQGKENVPAGAVMLCANHASAWDPILLYLILYPREGLGIMAKRELMDIPVLGSALRKLGAFAVDRGNADLLAVKTGLRCLKDGRKLLIFPEGTRVVVPGQTRPKGGATMMALRTGVPIVPVYLDGPKRLFHRVRVIFGQPYYPGTAGKKPTPEENQQLADEVMQRIYRLAGEDVSW